MILPAAASTPHFVVGQRYACGSSHADRQLEVTVGQVDVLSPDVTVVSVSLVDKAPQAAIPVMAHAPFEAGVLAKSCPTLLAGVATPDAQFKSGYAMWREAWDGGRGGYFTIGVDQAIDAALAVIKQNGGR